MLLPCTSTNGVACAFGLPSFRVIALLFLMLLCLWGSPPLCNPSAQKPEAIAIRLLGECSGLVHRGLSSRGQITVDSTACHQL